MQSTILQMMKVLIILTYMASSKFKGICTALYNLFLNVFLMIIYSMDMESVIQFVVVKHINFCYLALLICKDWLSLICY
jgi:hypothetical protein